MLSLVGAGGVGEVYRPGSRLGRDVAIKVLPAERMADEGRRRRLVQEAGAAFALVPGQTLDVLIPKNGMRLGEVTRTAIPIADALAAAHSRGIVHRDLEPG